MAFVPDRGEIYLTGGLADMHNAWSASIITETVGKFNERKVHIFWEGQKGFFLIFQFKASGVKKAEDFFPCIFQILCTSHNDLIYLPIWFLLLILYQGNVNLSK